MSEGKAVKASHSALSDLLVYLGVFVLGLCAEVLTWFFAATSFLFYSGMIVALLIAVIGLVGSIKSFSDWKLHRLWCPHCKEKYNLEDEAGTDVSYWVGHGGGNGNGVNLTCTNCGKNTSFGRICQNRAIDNSSSVEIRFKDIEDKLAQQRKQDPNP